MACQNGDAVLLEDFSFPRGIGGLPGRISYRRRRRRSASAPSVSRPSEVGDPPDPTSQERSEPPLGDRYYDPIYRAAQDLGLPIVYHGNTPGIDEFPIAGLQKFLEAHTLGFLFYNMATLVSVVVQGLPERFPGLKFVFQECGLSYVPTVMLRLDTSYRKRRSEAPLLKKLPSEYIREFYYGTQPLEEPNTPQEQAFLAATYNAIDGANTLMFATDYPHWDYNNVKVINRMPFIAREDREKILSGNALKVFRFNGFDLEAARSRRPGTTSLGTVTPVPD